MNDNEGRTQIERKLGTFAREMGAGGDDVLKPEADDEANRRAGQ